MADTSKMIRSVGDLISELKKLDPKKPVVVPSPDNLGAPNGVTITQVLELRNGTVKLSVLKDRTRERGLWEDSF